MKPLKQLFCLFFRFSCIYVQSLKYKKNLSLYIIILNFERNHFKEETVNIDDIPIKEREGGREMRVFTYMYTSVDFLSVFVSVSATFHL